MGCSLTRNKNDQGLIEAFESRLQMDRFSIAEIKKAFSHASGASSVSLKQIQKFIGNLNIQYSVEDKSEVFDKFISYFEIGEDAYDFTDILSTFFILSTSPIKEKALGLFDLFDKRCTGILYKEEAEFAVNSICKSVCGYTERFLDGDEETKEIYTDIWTKTEEAKSPELIEFFFHGRAYIKCEDFEDCLVKAAHSKELLDITSPQSIRRSLMGFLYSTPKSKLELLEMCKTRRSKTKFAFENGRGSHPDSSSNTARNAHESIPITTKGQ